MEQEWTSVLVEPPYLGWYLVTIRRDPVRNPHVQLAAWDYVAQNPVTVRWLDTEDWEPLDCVTAWMPLPVPFEG